ncbi:MAG: hypothetical protein CVU39_07775 [Chloroflexi bacterium HGW-Chloroflexi-10]|nr:MAG: hypothetical protein CVU39_07775 [Chloroflexi bacterium HGW-Chloroflexi-10]
MWLKRLKPYWYNLVIGTVMLVMFINEYQRGSLNTIAWIIYPLLIITNVGVIIYILVGKTKTDSK